MSEPTNLLILMSDEHSRKIFGCYGNDIVKTPNLDRLAARGTLFTDAYSTSPICVPARASLATGYYAHATSNWDNAFPYVGDPHSWGHRLQEAGVPVGSIGKLHYRNAEDATGFDFQELPMHLVNGVGDVLGCVREPLPQRWKTRKMAEDIGPGQTSYSNYDRAITEAAEKWLSGRKAGGAPWAALVSMVTPHFPLIAPPEFYEMYADIGMMPSKARDLDEHPWLQEMRTCFLYDNFTEESTRIALASYYGLVSFMDHCMGRVLDALDAAGLTETTRILYISDHGDNAGQRGLWGKSVMFEESAGVPGILAGPGVPSGHTCRTPVSLIDVYPTVMDTFGLSTDTDDRPGRSLVDIANAPDATERVVFSEYHASGSCSGAFMIRSGHWKYIHYAGFRPQLFDLKNDPEELCDLGNDPDHAAICHDLEAKLRTICDPDDVERRAKADQAALIERNGGRDAVVAKGGFGATPPPGQKAAYS